MLTKCPKIKTELLNKKIALLEVLMGKNKTFVAFELGMPLWQIRRLFSELDLLSDNLIRDYDSLSNLLEIKAELNKRDKTIAHLKKRLAFETLRKRRLLNRA